MENQAYEPVFYDGMRGSEDAQGAANDVSTDFSKALNAVSHSTLISRMGEVWTWRYGWHQVRKIREKPAKHGWFEPMV